MNAKLAIEQPRLPKDDFEDIKATAAAAAGKAESISASSKGGQGSPCSSCGDSCSKCRECPACCYDNKNPEAIVAFSSTGTDILSKLKGAGCS